MKIQHLKLSFSLLFLASLPASLLCQETLEVRYNAEENSMDLTALPKKIKYRHTYNLVLKQINTAHVEQLSTVTQSRLVSALPNILSSLYIGIPDDAALSSLPGPQGNPRGLYLKALNYYEKLITLQQLSNSLYMATSFKPDQEIAKGSKDALLQALNVKTLTEAYTELSLAQKYISNVQDVYTAQLENLSLGEGNTVKILEELATIKSINASAGAIDYTYLLQFIEDSQTAVSTLPITTFTASKDIVDVNLQLYDTYSRSMLLEEQLSFGVYENFSFDFSTGFFYNNLVEPEYFTEQNPNGNVYIRQEDQTKIDVAIGALGHFSYKIEPDLRAGIALGAAISPFDGKLRYLLGPSAIWGKEKQLALSFGLALAQVDELSASVNNDALGTYLPEGAGDIPTVNRLKSGFFIGITYNLTNTKQP